MHPQARPSIIHLNAHQLQNHSHPQPIQKDGRDYRYHGSLNGGGVELKASSNYILIRLSELSIRQILSAEDSKTYKYELNFCFTRLP